MLLRTGQLLVGCVVLGLGVAGLLVAALGSDGYSTMINGLSLALGLPFLAVNVSVGVVLVLLAWLRGHRPGVGTVTQPLVVGSVVSLVLGTVETPDSLAVRVALLAISLPVLSLGIAAYLAADLGAGPTEVAALALDPPVPFRWSYGVVQGGGALAGWVCGAAVGVGTVLVIALIGPLVAWFASLSPLLRAPDPDGPDVTA